jgi:hypothetical protein
VDEHARGRRFEIFVEMEEGARGPASHSANNGLIRLAGSNPNANRFEVRARTKDSSFLAQSATVAVLFRRWFDSVTLSGLAAGWRCAPACGGGLVSSVWRDGGVHRCQFLGRVSWVREGSCLDSGFIPVSRVPVCGIRSSSLFLVRSSRDPVRLSRIRPNYDRERRIFRCRLTPRRDGRNRGGASNADRGLPRGVVLPSMPPSSIRTGNRSRQSR